MPQRLRHALRFAIPTLVVVYLVGVLWEVVDVYALGDVAEGLDAAATLRFNEHQWRTIAAIEAAVVFLLRLGDMEVGLPSWTFAVLVATWLGLASVAAAYAVDDGRVTLAAIIAVSAAVVWLLFHRWLPGWPGAMRARGGSSSATEQDLR